MTYLKIENKAGKIKLNDTVTKQSIGKVIDEIGKLFGATASNEGADFGEIMNAAENGIDTLNIEINSPGGSIFDGYTMYQEIKSLQDRGVYVTATITGMAASMASVICMACDKVEIVPHGRMMIHDASVSASGNAESLRKSADLVDNLSADIANLYSEKTGIQSDEIREMMKAETWMTAKESVSKKFADTIFDTKAKNMASILYRFKPDAALTEKVIGLESAIVDAENQISELAENLATRESDLQNAVTELAEVKASNEEITAKLAESESALQSEKEAVIAKASEIDSLNAKLVEVEAEANAKLAEAENSAARKAAEILAMAGVPPVDNTGDNGRVNVVTRDEFNAMTIMQRNEYMRNCGKIN
jgi:ATP-dependent protease ClpP protease subunit